MLFRSNQVIRPWKSRLGLLYVESGRSVSLDLRILWLTLLAAVNREAALAGVRRIAASLGATGDLLAIISRTQPLPAAAPPGGLEVVRSRAIVA